MDVQRFRIYLDDGVANPATHDLTIIPADRMRAERASTDVLPPSQRGRDAAKAHPNTWVLLWLWASATRAKITSAKFADWADLVLDFDPIDRDGNVKATDDDEAEAPQLDPTSAAAATS